MKKSSRTIKVILVTALLSITSISVHADLSVYADL